MTPQDPRLSKVRALIVGQLCEDSDECNAPFCIAGRAALALLDSFMAPPPCKPTCASTAAEGGYVLPCDCRPPPEGAPRVDVLTAFRAECVKAILDWRNSQDPTTGIFAALAERIRRLPLPEPVSQPKPVTGEDGLTAYVETLRAKVVMLRNALDRAHACATLREDGDCDGCFVTEALGRAGLPSLPTPGPAKEGPAK